MMQRFQNIVLVYECDHATLERAAALARENRATLTIVYPLPQLPGSSQVVTVGDRHIDVGRLVLRECKTQLDEIARSVREHGVRPHTRVLVGEPSQEIIRDVIEHRRDLVIMTAEGHGGMKDRLFGSTSRHLMRKCPIPLFILKPSRRQHFQHVLAAIDIEATGDARDTLNKLILELGASLSAHDGALLHVVHAWSLLGEALLRGRGGLFAADVEHTVRAEGAKRRHAIESLLKQHAVVGSRIHLHKGDAADVIPRVAAKIGADVLVMGTVCRTGIPGFLIGNTAESVLDVVDCSVLVVKPEGFATPVVP